ncbi:MULTISPECIES: iron-containing alcohol dehydrogenase [unclassified Micromonospora]|uniref:iron-containing alcohol dehydrogenase n=1 Tax=unclassified Micromonospora TaxID=2617518 RepID=UPI002FF0F361
MFTSFRSPALVEFGADGLERLAEICQSFGVSRPLIITDEFLAASPLIEKITQPLVGAGVEYGLFRNTLPEPTTASIDTLREKFESDDYDGLIPFGGGSAMDSAKALAITETFGKDYRRWVVPHTPAGRVSVPIICVPTTAGSGSEVSNACILKDSATGEKLVYLGQSCVPSAAVVDYELTLNVPASLTASTGIDALAHSLEAYTSTGANPFSDAMALSALSLIGPNLRTVIRQPNDREARRQVMLGATQAGYAFTSAGVTLVHGMTAPLGGLFGIQHGVSNAMVMPTVHRWSTNAAQKRYAAAARALGLAAEGHDDATASQLVADELTALNRDLGLPSMQFYGLDKKRYFEQIDTMTEQAFLTGGPGLNPRVPTSEEMADLYRAAWEEKWD